MSTVLQFAWLPDGLFDEMARTHPDLRFVDARQGNSPVLPEAVIAYGLPPLADLPHMTSLRWIQLISAGVPQDLCPSARQRNIAVTNLAGLYGPTIAEHALGLMTVLTRNLHVAMRQQAEKRWDRALSYTMTDLAGKTLGIVGLGNIGTSIARLARAYGMQVIGCRRKADPAPYVDRVYPLAELKTMLAQADVVAVAAPLTRHTDGLLGPAEFAAMKRGTFYVNVSRGPIAQEKALVEALTSGHLGGAGLDVFAVEPLSPEHPLWTLPNVVITPHYSGETVNLNDPPARRFLRNLVNWRQGRTLEGIVDLEWGY